MAMINRVAGRSDDRTTGCPVARWSGRAVVWSLERSEDRSSVVTLLLSSAMRSRKRAAIAAGLPLALLVIAYVAGHAYVRGAAFVVQAAGMHGMVRTLAEWQTTSITEDRLTVPWRGGELPARRYLPVGRHDRVFLLTPGVHASGVDEPRLVGFARDLASMGHAVVTIGPPDLAHYAITVRSTDAIEDAATWLGRQRDLAPDGHIVMMGISFAGGLSIVAAGRPSLRDTVRAVVSLGGHGDLPRTLRYLCTGDEPGSAHRPPHDYGVVIILLGVVDRVVPGDQVEGLRRAVLTFLEASRLDLIDKAKSVAEFEHAKTLAASLPEPSRTIMGYVNARDVAHLGPLLLPHVTAFGGDPALSPARSPAPSARVFLLHGTDDNVIPAAESILLARQFTEQHVPVELLATPLITHAEVDQASDMKDVWRLIAFWTGVLGE
jgi:dienelactone hydrolase